LSNLSDLNSYKKAKILARELEDLLRTVSSFKKQLHPYLKYNPVKDIYSSLQDNEQLIKIHYKKYKKIVDQKGEI
jgi:vacuolar-type H+-ATPase subunit D/Vma8